MRKAIGLPSGKAMGVQQRSWVGTGQDVLEDIHGNRYHVIKEENLESTVVYTTQKPVPAGREVWFVYRLQDGRAI